MKNLDEKIRNNLAVWFLGTLVAGFAAGIATYKAILEIAKLDVVQEGLYIMRDELSENYVTKNEFESLNQQYQLLIRENQHLSQSKPKSQVKADNAQERKRYLLRLQELIDEGNLYIQSKLKEFDFEVWKSECSHLLDSVDKLRGTSYKSEFVNVTSHTKSKVFLDYPSVRKALPILNAVKDILNY